MTSTAKSITKLAGMTQRAVELINGGGGGGSLLLGRHGGGCGCGCC